MAFTTLALLTVGAAALILGLFFWWLRRTSRSERERYVAQHSRINGIPLAEAVAEANCLLADPRCFRLIESPNVAEASMAGLPPAVRGLFARYDAIELLDDPGAILERCSIGPSQHRDGYTRIGVVAHATDMEGEICVLPGDTRLFEVHSDGIDNPLGVYASIHHWIVAVANENQ